MHTQINKKKRFIVLLLLLTPTLIWAQTTASKLQDIRTKYSTIRENLTSYEETVVEIMNESLEGGHATAYTDHSEIKLIEVAYYGEMWKQITAYYYDQDKIFFVFDQHFRYNHPFYLTKEKAEEMGLKTYHDPKKTTVEETRFYFFNEKLFRYLDEDKKEVDLVTEENALKGEFLLKEAQRMKAIFEKEK